MIIVTVIAAKSRSESLQVVTGRLDAHQLGKRPVEIKTIGEDMFQFTYSGIELGAFRDVIGEVEDADVIIAPSNCLPPKLFVADMDSTMIGQECIDELAAEVGIKDQVAAITERAMRGELDFSEALRARLALLEGLDVGVIDTLLAERITPNPGAAELISGLKASGVRCVLVSGGFTHFAEPIGRRLGFDRVVANRLEIVDGKLTGKVVGEIVDADTKRRVLLEEAGDETERSVAIGDGANDLLMMGVAGVGIAYRAKPKVAAEADARLDHASLDKLLVALGLDD